MRHRRLGFGFAFAAAGVAWAPWEVPISALEARQGLCSETLQRATAALRHSGFVVLRGASLFAEQELRDAEAAAETQLEQIKKATEKLNLMDRAPWIPDTYRMEKLFEFQEALCYSQGRLDMPQLLQVLDVDTVDTWRGVSHLCHLSKHCFDAECALSVLGSLWNFPKSGPPVWHRDGEARLLVAVTAPKDYPEAVGFIHAQPKTHLKDLGGRLSSPGAQAPSEESGEEDVHLPLRRGETLVFHYSTKHAATPNLSDQERCLIYGVLGPVGVQDAENHKAFLPSIFKISQSEASNLDGFYRSRGYFTTGVGSHRSGLDFVPLALPGLCLFLLALAQR